MGKPGRKCLCCTHPERAKIDLLLASGVGRDVISQRFGINEFAIHRHSKAHLSPAARLALITNSRPTDTLDLDALRQREGSNLLAGFADQHARLRALGDVAAQSGDFGAATATEKAITKIYE